MQKSLVHLTRTEVIKTYPTKLHPGELDWETMEKEVEIDLSRVAYRYEIAEARIFLANARGQLLGLIDEEMSHKHANCVLVMRDGTRHVLSDIGHGMIP